MDCGTATAKYILFIFNTFVSIIGILAIVQGVMLNSSLPTISEHGTVQVQSIFAFFLIVVGSVILFISFLGCCGAIRESVCMTMTYAVLLLIMLILQLTFVTVLFTYKDEIQKIMGEVIDDAWKARSHDRIPFEIIQKSLKCCGRVSSADYALGVESLPSSCCDSGSCLPFVNSYGGCRDKFIEFMSGNTETAKIAGIVLIVIEMVGFIFACCLANNVNNYKRRINY